MSESQSLAPVTGGGKTALGGCGSIPGWPGADRAGCIARTADQSLLGQKHRGRGEVGIR